MYRPDIISQYHWPTSTCQDSDGDGYYFEDGSCTLPAGATGGDCDDEDALEHPGQVWYLDGDDDGYAPQASINVPTIACERPAGGYKVAAELAGGLAADCNDGDGAVNPGAEEVLDDAAGVDENCDGIVGISTHDPGGDTDDDGIPDDQEALLGTDPAVKTLFVRPKNADGSYWAEFADLLPHPVKVGFGQFSADTISVDETVVTKTVEIFILGHPDPLASYAPMRGAAGMSYNPADDDDVSNCDIVEIVHEDMTAISEDSTNAGHIFFNPLPGRQTWMWDQRGYTEFNIADPHYGLYGYYTAQIFPYPIETYFTEGPYTSLAGGQSALDGADLECEADGREADFCYVLNLASPLNVNNDNPVNGAAAAESPPQTVQNSAFVFNADTSIEDVPADWDAANKYERADVKRQVVLHELGHVLTENAGHCENKDCPLCEFTDEYHYGPKVFGANGACSHGDDIMADGIVHNFPH